MSPQPEHDGLSKVFFGTTLALCAALAVAVVALAVGQGGNDLSSFSEPVSTLADGWTITDSAGNAREAHLPETIEYGTDGTYTLSCTLPDVGGSLASPAFRFYSNYVDVSIALGGRELYSFPRTAAAFSGATGNTYHFVRLPVDYVGQTLTISVHGQLGSSITYLLTPPLLGSKATMLGRDVVTSLPSFTLAGCMGILALGLGVLYLAFRKRLALNNATLYTALFALLFAAYVYCETSFAQLLSPNGYLLCFVTLALLALLPIPLIGIFLNAAGLRFRPVMYGLMVLCSVNLVVQGVLNFAGVASIRAMLPATHAVIVLVIATVSLCLWLSDRAERPDARRALLSAVPMIVGGMTDIILINVNQPSLNNCFWFALGVIAFIVIQLCGFAYNYFALYHTSLEAQLLTDMAYRDVLSGISNRNAYERKLKKLYEHDPSDSLCCIVIDINDLKAINDTLGHQAGDAAIAAVGKTLRECMPPCASYFRTGGDEFVILLEDYDEQRTCALAKRVTDGAKRHSEQHLVPLSLAIGWGQYVAGDGNIIDFIRRVDTLMYECKRRYKQGKWLPAVPEGTAPLPHGRQMGPPFLADGLDAGARPVAAADLQEGGERCQG